MQLNPITNQPAEVSEGLAVSAFRDIERINAGVRFYYESVCNLPLETINHLLPFTLNLILIEYTRNTVAQLKTASLQRGCA